MDKKKSSLLRTAAVVLLVGAVLLVTITPAYALNSFLKTWNSLYAHSSTGDADCSVCHGTSTSNLNAYGKDLCLAFNGSVPGDLTPYIQAIEALDSDMDGNSNLVEIDAGAQPGWTTGGNQLYATLDGGCAPVGSPVSAPASVPLPYDPPAGGDPLAVPGGPYAGYVNVPVTFDGSPSYDSDGGTITSYAWDFGDGATGSGAVVQHTYTTAATYTVTLTVVDDEGASSTNTTIATISGAAVLDLDIVSLKVTSSVKAGKPIAIQLSVENPGVVLGQALATVEGKRDGLTVYRWQLNVYDYNSGGATSFTFPTYTSTVKGAISWTATIADVDPDVDSAAATTIVK